LGKSKKEKGGREGKKTGTAQEGVLSEWEEKKKSFGGRKRGAKRGKMGLARLLKVGEIKKSKNVDLAGEGKKR